MLNINNSDDPNYRYKMPAVSIKFNGGGNGKHTIINNINEIAQAINSPPMIVCKYISIFNNIHEDDIELAHFTNNLIDIFSVGAIEVK